MVSVGSKGWKVSVALSRVATVRAKRAGTVPATGLSPRFMASGHVACISRAGARRCAKKRGNRRPGPPKGNATGIAAADPYRPSGDRPGGRKNARQPPQRLSTSISESPRSRMEGAKKGAGPGGQAARGSDAGGPMDGRGAVVCGGGDGVRVRPWRGRAKPFGGCRAPPRPAKAYAEGAIEIGFSGGVAVRRLQSTL